MIGFGTVHTVLDLDSPGKRSGWADLDHSDDRHAYAAIRSPLGVIRGGAGPVALVTGGNHGDEYEGQIIARRLFAALEPADLAGGLILMPSLNMPAVLAASRVSPLDGGNMNRAFPGAEGAGPTRALAGFVTRHLMRRAQLAVDLHSGGTGLDFADSAYLVLSGDAATDRQSRDLALAMGLPWTAVTPPGHTGGDLDAAAQAAGCATISCELGGMGRVSRRALRAGWQGVLRVLAAQGVLSPAAAARLGADNPAPATRFVDLGAASGTLTAMRQALVEPLAGIGEAVAQGQTVARLFDLFDLGAPPQDLAAPVSGRVLIRRRGALVQPGDHLMTICPEIASPAA